MFTKHKFSVIAISAAKTRSCRKGASTMGRDSLGLIDSHPSNPCYWGTFTYQLPNR